MYVVLGGTGHVGSSLAERLLRRNERVTVVTRREQNRKEWEHRGAEVAVLDVRDVDALRAVFARAPGAFLLNPPADPATDSASEERKTVRAILAALEGAELARIVALSTYGAQPGESIGDLGVLYELEEALRQRSSPAAIIRAAYYLSNWDGALQSARDEGRLYSFFPADFELPMVAPADIAELACRLLTGSAVTDGIHCIEGPARYTPADVARAYSRALGKPVEVTTFPEEGWVGTLQELGFSSPAARSMAAMTHIVLHRKYELPAVPERGQTSLEDYVRRLVRSTP